MEYYGSYWTSTNIKLACSEGLYSTKACPRPTMGGYRMNSDAPYDMTTWHYNYSGDSYDAEVAGYAAQSCNTNPFGVWLGAN